MNRLIALILITTLVVPSPLVCAEQDHPAHPHTHPHPNPITHPHLYQKEQKPSSGHAHGGAPVALALLAHSITSVYALPDNLKDAGAWTELALHVTELLTSLGSLTFMGAFAKPEVILYSLAMILAASLLKSRKRKTPAESSTGSATALDQLSDTERAGALAKRHPIVDRYAGVIENALAARHHRERMAVPRKSPEGPSADIRHPGAPRRVIGRRSPSQSYRPFLDKDFYAVPETRAALSAQERFLRKGMLQEAAAVNKEVEVVR
jgi:hypothetical protein